MFLIIYTKKIQREGWLRARQLIPNRVQKSEVVQKVEIFALIVNQMRALDGATHGAVFA